jgi:hypothetical protein
MIGETGWASDGLTKTVAETSSENLARYFSEVSKWAADNNVPLFYFEAFDEKWKGNPDDPNDPNALVEKHWGIWDSNGHLKRTFIPEPVLCENFDPNANPFCTRKEWSWKSTAPDPNIEPNDPNSDGQFLRLLYDGTGETHFASAAFDRVAVGLYPLIEAQFDFRMYGPDANDDADGFSFMLIPTLLNGTANCSQYNPENVFAEQPKLPKTFAVGFGIYQNDQICVSWDGNLYPDDVPIDVSQHINLNNGAFHRALIELRADGNDMLVSLTIDPNVCDPNGGEPLVVAENLRIPGLKPYENRVEFIGRNGGLDINVDIDNICVRYKPEICESLVGDINADCKVDFYDLAILASNWLEDSFEPPNWQ